MIQSRPLKQVSDASLSGLSTVQRRQRLYGNDTLRGAPINRMREGLPEVDPQGFRVDEGVTRIRE